MFLANSAVLIAPVPKNQLLKINKMTQNGYRILRALKTVNDS